MYKSALSYALVITLLVQLVWPPANAEDAAGSQGNPPAAAGSSVTQQMMTLPPGTPLNLEMLEELYSQRNHEGDEIVFAEKKDAVTM